MYFPRLYANYAVIDKRIILGYYVEKGPRILCGGKELFMTIQRRDVALAIVLSIITCGFYTIYWFIVLTDEVNALAGETEATSGSMAFLFTLVTCGIYSYFWMYKMGEKLDNVAVSQGKASQSRGILYLILSVLGLGLIAYALMQDSINKSI